MDSRLRMFLAEMFGTFLLVLVAAGTLCACFLPVNDPRFYTVGGITLAAALSEGIALAVAVSATCHLSQSCCNPAITLGLWVSRRLELGTMLGLIGAQLLGAFLAGLTLRGLFAVTVLADARMGTPHLKALVGPEGIVTLGSLASGIALEALFTLFLTVAVHATLIDPRAPRLGGFGVGLAQTAIVLFGFHLTGGAANPARWFGPMVWEFSVNLPATVHPLADHAVYWVGPILGALAGCVFYNLVILQPQKS